MFKEKEIVNLDGVDYEVNSVTSDGGMWLQKDGGNHYYDLLYLDAQEINVKIFSGSLSSGRSSKVRGGTDHTHFWRRYIGMTEIYDYCSCGAKKDIHWTELGDKKKNANSER